MFKTNTVFILGAGASWHYGYPTGEQLVERVISRAKELEQDLKQLKDSDDFQLSTNVHIQHLPAYIIKDGNLEKTIKDCRDLYQRLSTTNAPVIDYFLEWNPGLADIGKFIIAWEILDCQNIFLESNKKLFHTDPSSGKSQEKGDWYRFILYKLVSGYKATGKGKIDLSKNNRVSFITFNYDISLEQSLLMGLQAMEFIPESEIETFFGDNRFIHVYGQVQENIYKPHYKGAILTKKDIRYSILQKKPILDAAYKASQHIKTIPEMKDDNKKLLNKAKKKIAKAEEVYILGFGFDSENCGRLKLKENLGLKTSQNKRILFTNFEDRDAINKRVNALFDLNGPNGENENFSAGGKSVFSSRIVAGNNHYERSTQNVYTAIERDFDFL